MSHRLVKIFKKITYFKSKILEKNPDKAPLTQRVSAPLGCQIKIFQPEFNLETFNTDSQPPITLTESLMNVNQSEQSKNIKKKERMEVYNFNCLFPSSNLSISFITYLCLLYQT